MTPDGKDRNHGAKSLRKTHRKLFDWLLLPFYLLINKNHDSWCVMIWCFVILKLGHTMLQSKEELLSM